MNSNLIEASGAVEAFRLKFYYTSSTVYNFLEVIHLVREQQNCSSAGEATPIDWMSDSKNIYFRSQYLLLQGVSQKILFYFIIENYHITVK